ncbi:thermonuclease family protein [Corynebacterium rhinophilum]|uniref:thermonuclease family protein n=1 Tax=Corynebacterium rhinophilum TaxID=3050197 RepID=UPI00397B597A
MVSIGVGAANSDEHVVVNRVIDGDTIDVTIDGDKSRVRLLNIDTPEIGRNGKPSECLAEEAKEYLEGRLPKGTEVTLEYDEEKNDMYGRTLAGVFLEDDLVNADIAAEGLAVAKKIGANDKFYNQVKEAESGPKTKGTGVFGVSDECQVSSDEDMTESLQQAEGATAAAAGMGITAVNIDSDDDGGAAKVLAQIYAARKGLDALRGGGDDRSEFQKAAYPEAPERLAKQLEKELSEHEEDIENQVETAKQEKEKEEQERKERERERQEAAEREAVAREAERERLRAEEDSHGDAAAPVAESNSGARGSQHAAPQPQQAPRVDTYTGCRAYGGNYAFSSVDKNGRAYAKIDCTTKQQIG